MRITAIILSVGFLAGCASTAEAPKAAAKPASAGAASAEQKECRETKELRSIIAKKVCHTKEEWAAIDASQKASVDKYKSDAKSVGGGEEQ